MEYLRRNNHEPFETRKNHKEPLLEEDALIFSLQCEHLSTSTNFTLVARRSTTSEGTLYRSRRLLVCWEKNVENYLAFLHLACEIGQHVNPVDMYSERLVPDLVAVQKLLVYIRITGGRQQRWQHVLMAHDAVQD